MKKIIAVALLLAIPASALAMPASIYISEIGAHEPSGTEWVRIINGGLDAVDISKWKFYEDGSNHGLTMFRGSGILTPGDSAVIGNKADEYAAKFSEDAGNIFDSSWGSLKEDGEEIGLKNGEGVLVESFVYPALARSDILIRTETGWNHPQPSATSTEEVIADEIGTSTETILEAATTTPGIDPPQPAPPPPAPPPSPPLAAPPAQQASPAPRKNNYPHAIITVQSGSVISQGPTSINFDGRGSSDPDGDALTYLWDFGDGTVDNGPNPNTHRYTLPGAYIARLTVFDSFGASHAALTPIQILESRQAAMQAFMPQPQNIQTETAKETEVRLVVLNEKELKEITRERTQEQNREVPSPILALEKSASKARMLISEIFPSPETKGEQEWIELENKSSMPADISGWVLADVARQRHPYRFPASTVITGHGFLVITKKQSGISLNNDADVIGLATGEGELIDTISYRAGETGASFARSSSEKNLWQWTQTPTPGKPNPDFTRIAGTVTALRLPDAERGGGVSVQSADGSQKNLRLAEEYAYYADVLLPEGAAVSLAAEKNRDGDLEVQSIERIEAPRDIIATPENNFTGPIFIFFAAAVVIIIVVQGAIGYCLYVIARRADLIGPIKKYPHSTDT